MVRKILVYIEGDTKKGNAAAVTLREGFSVFFQTLADKIRVPVKPVMCGARETAIRLFLANLDADSEGFIVLLVDSESAVGAGETPKDFLRKISPKFDFRKVGDDQCHLMVELMESWFLADRKALAGFFGPGFNPKALPQNKNVEQIPKTDVLAGLKNATRKTAKKEYGKGAHSGEILRQIDSAKVRRAAPHCEKLFEAIEKKAGE
ncbi:MAG: DUF4276 family protein [Acidobacteria bacterium]|nr:DUF4276 family protein [Acidobacteriota bacterium]